MFPIVSAPNIVAVVTTRLVVPAALRLHQEMSNGSVRRISKIRGLSYNRPLTDGREEVSDVVAGHQTTGTLPRNLGKTNRTGNGENYDDSENGPSKLDLVGDEDTGQQSDDTNGTGWHLHENSGESVEAESFGDQTTKGTDTTRGTSSAEPHPGPHESLGVTVGFTELVPLELGRLGQSWGATNCSNDGHTLVPVLFSLKRSMAISLSLPFLRNLAVVGELGMRYQTTGTMAREKQPMNKKMPWYCLITVEEPVALPIA